MRQSTAWSKDLRVTADRAGVVGMIGVIGVIGLWMLADRTGLTQGISTVLSRLGSSPGPRRARVLTDVACSIAVDGGLPTPRPE